jgi:iron complex outermembrane receptor protein
MKRLFLIVLIYGLNLNLFAQHNVTGIVSEQNESNPLPGATVRIENSNYGTSTDLNGNFKLKLPNGSYKLVVTYLGYVKVERNFSVLNKDEELKIMLTQDAFQLVSLEVISTRINQNSAMSGSYIDSASIAKNNLGMDLPYMLDQTPSVVVTSDAGNGIGYSGIRIRGSDPTRINVTINGIPVNDAESQGVFWVDFPDLASSTNSIQVQRGAGSSTNGAGAFGGTINIETSNDREKAFAEISNSYGSFNSRKHTLKSGTGKISLNSLKGSYFSLDSRLSWIASDGYIDRAFSDLKSFYISAGLFTRNSSLRFIAFSGKEKTYQAWGGVPKDSLESNRTFNPYSYKNETDNYIQSNYQLHYNFKLNVRLKGNISLHYTKGAGYFEQYKSGESFVDYGLEDIYIGGDTITETDLIRRRWLDNDFYGAIYSLHFSPSNKFDIIYGGGINKFHGKHFGEVIWAEYSSNSSIEHQYYRDSADKIDFNNFLKTNYWLTKNVNFFVDLQLRNVNYQFNGYDRNLDFINQKSNLLFFNPKFGLTAYLPKNQIVYSSFAIANKEPNRDDFTSSSANSRPRPERMMDIEIGYRYSSLKFIANLNVYHMQYKDQLVLTGKINDVGAYTRQNISDSYRQGIELEAGMKLNNYFNFSFNTSFSNNKILNYIEYIDNWDTWQQDSVRYSQTDIAFSPSLIVAGSFNFNLKINPSFRPMFLVVYKKNFVTDLEFSLIPKYVGKQFIDNTSNVERQLDGYFTTDARISFIRKAEKSGRFISFNFLLRNMLNKLYVNNAWAYTYSLGGQQFSDIGYYPQAGINYFMGLTFGF